MDDEHKRALLDSALEMVVAKLGDPQDSIFAHYYRRFPEALAAFEHHGFGKRRELEGEMVAQVLYCLMTWFQSPFEVSVVLQSSVPHHSETLAVQARWYEGLLAATVEVFVAALPESAGEERAVLREAGSSLTAVVRASVEGRGLSFELAG